jgi:hypothetical protein
LDEKTFVRRETDLSAMLPDCLSYGSLQRSERATVAG